MMPLVNPDARSADLAGITLYKSLGFCQEHADQCLERLGDQLGVAIIYEDLVSTDVTSSPE